MGTRVFIYALKSYIFNSINSMGEHISNSTEKARREHLEQFEYAMHYQVKLSVILFLTAKIAPPYLGSITSLQQHF